ncbi:SUMF1/EgtB/PvdO family nonheme iron enzyme [Betaproteobacteria bacterium LSUCC0117]|nr:SUMF1/EgtB/PvdO family nonheme iron enzyme [Betaproteobacteria bacterium LSUCC0117]
MITWHSTRQPLCAALLTACMASGHAAQVPQQRIGNLLWDAHEVTVGQVQAYATATGFVSQAERAGGGMVYEAGWTQKPGWSWRAPYGQPAAADEPAAHLTFNEASAICQHVGKRLPTDAEWVNAAYQEQRPQPTAPFVTGQRYRYPNGDKATGSNHLGSRTAVARSIPSGALTRGRGHAPVMSTTPGVNGLWDMGGNLWEWVDSGATPSPITRGASWWYGPERQVEDDVATKPMDTAVIYIGFRCVQAIVKK